MKCAPENLAHNNAKSQHSNTSDISSNSSPNFNSDNRSEAFSLRENREMIHNSARTVTQRQVFTELRGEQGTSFANSTTGLPDQLKHGVENLSGYSLNHVKVHYNSSKPAQLSASAYARGSEIYVAPGQEKHLPHEAWHVVQQMQERVKPTVQLNGVDINDDQGLEKEADIMGNKALEFNGTPCSLQYKDIQGQPIVQGYFEVDDNFNTYVRRQVEQQGEIKKGTNPKERFTTVGFEHEFAQTIGQPLSGISHLELAESTLGKMPLTDTGFKLETDADMALELVSPPFLVRTLPGHPIPQPDDIEKIDNIIREDLSIAISSAINGTTVESNNAVIDNDTIKSKDENDTQVAPTSIPPIKLEEDIGSSGSISNTEEPARGTLDALVNKLNTRIGLDFALQNVTVKPKNISHNMKAGYHAKKPLINKSVLKQIEVKEISKGKKGITSQVNFATDARVFDTMQQISKQEYAEEEEKKLAKEKEKNDQDERKPDLEQKKYEEDEKEKKPDEVVKLEKEKEKNDQDERKPNFKQKKYEEEEDEEKKPEEVVKTLEEEEKQVIVQKQPLTPTEKIFIQLESQLLAILHACEFDKGDANLVTFVNILARALSGQVAVPAINYLKNKQEEIFKEASAFNKSKIGTAKAPEHKTFIFNATMTSKVKDINEVWIKDTLVNVGLGLLSTPAWKMVIDILQNPKLHDGIRSLTPPVLDKNDTVPGYGRDKIMVHQVIEEKLQQGKVQMFETIDILLAKAKSFAANDYAINAQIFDGPKNQPDFMSHSPNWIGPRQDTYINAQNVQLPDVWPGTRLHVVETRKNGTDMLRKLANHYGKQGSSSNSNSKLE